MKIAIDIRPLGIKRRTGVEEYLIGILDEIFKFDQKNEYVLFNNSFIQENREFENYAKNYPNVEIVNLRVPNKIFNSGLTFLGYPHLDELCGFPDVFFSPSWNFCKVSGDVKHILTVHDLSFEVSPDFFPFKKRLWHKVIGAKRQAMNADKIIAVSESTKNDLINIYGIEPEKIEVVYLGVNKKFFEQCPEEEKNRVKTKYNLPEKFILFVGTIEPRKGIGSLIKAFEEFKRKNQDNTNLVIAGANGWSYKEILKLAKNSPEAANIKLTGFIEDADKPALMQLSQVFVYPSFYEGFGFPPLEAMASQIPVITSHNPSLPEIAGDAALMINSWNLNEFIWSLEQMMYNKELRERMIKRGIECAKKYKWEETARKTLEILLNG